MNPRDKVTMAIAAQFGNRARHVIDLVSRDIIRVSSVGCDLSQENMAALLNSIKQFLASNAIFYWITMNSTGVVIDREMKQVYLCSTDGQVEACRSLKSIVDMCPNWSLTVIETPAYCIDILCDLMKKNRNVAAPQNEGRALARTPPIDVAPIFDYAYKDVNGAITPNEQMDTFGQSAHHVYGEIRPESVTVLLKHMNLKDTDVFYDLGSGLGKVAIQAALCTEARAVGVELSVSRYERAKAAAKKIRDQYPELAQRLVPPKLEFINQNFTKIKLPPGAVVFTCSTCFDEPTMNIIKDMVQEARARIYTLRMLPGAAPPDHEFKLPMTWNMNGTSVYYYGGNGR
jgi:hypothetical protein